MKAGRTGATAMPSKSSAAKEADARPTKKARSSVPQILQDASNVLPDKEYIKLLHKHVLPGLGDDDFSAAFQQAIDKFQGKNDLVKRIKFDHFKSEIGSLAKALKKSLRTDWHDGTDDQDIFKCEMVGLMAEWLQGLFSVAALLHYDTNSQ